MIAKGFRQRLAERQKKLGSVLCVGLDPLSEKLPACLRTGTSDHHLALDIANWMEVIVDATAPFTSMFKPQKAHYEAIPNGAWVLQKVVRYIKWHYPTIPVFLDCKRGDIDRTQQRYQIAHFEIDGVDGMNFSPYMGEDCMEFLVNKDHLERALVGLCYTSNPKARQVQDVVLQDGRQYWEFIAQCILEWAQELGVVENAGLVMAAAYEKPKSSGIVFDRHLVQCRAIVGDKLWYLIPGYGTQGGYLAQTIRASFRGYGSIAINSSSGVIFASDGEDFAGAVTAKAREAHEQMEEIISHLAV